MRVFIPPPLHSYTGRASEVSLAPSGGTLGAVLHELDGRFPGIRFRIVDEQDRIRPHIQFFVRGATAKDLSHPVGADEEVLIVCALSGG